MARQRNLKPGSPKPRSAPLLKDKAYARIKDRILTNRFAPGDFLSERQVASWLGMSKTPIKAAFEKLELEGYIKVSPQQGVVVRDLNAREISEHFQFRAALETYIVKTLAGTLADQQIEILEKNLAAQERCVPNHDPKESVRLDREYHMIYCSFLQNAEIQSAMLAVKDKIYRVLHGIHSRYPDRFASNFPEHREIADAVIKGDGPLAASLMETHLENGKRFLLLP